MSNNIELNHCLFWLYYAKGLLQVKLKQYNDSINAFAASLDSENYSRVLVRNTELAQEELSNHKQILRTIERTIANKASSGDELSINSAAVKLAEKYKQVINLYEQLLNKVSNVGSLDFGAMFDIPLVENNTQNKKLKYGYTHYHRGLSQLATENKKEALKSFNEANKLLPEFCLPYIQKANIYREQKKYIKAVSQYDAAIRIENNNAGLYFNRSLVLFELGKPLEAKNDFNKYQSLNSAKT